MRVKMPTFNFEEGQAGAIADYFAIRSAKEWPSKYAKNLRFSMGTERNPDGVAGGALDWPALTNDITDGNGLTLEEMSEASEVSVTELEAIEAGYAASIKARFPNLKAFGDAEGFRMSGPASTSYERTERRSPAYLSMRGDIPAVGGVVAVEAVNCFTCHWNQGMPPGEAAEPGGEVVPGLPIAWAPDLAHTRDRLREDWSHDWMWNPSAIYPGTSMPVNFANTPPMYQDHFPGSSSGDQVQAVLDWLYNLDRLTPPAEN
jgi:hypothetical protein